jgi:hypothetical protein
MNAVAGWFLRWLTGWGDLIDGVSWVVTLGIWRPDVSLRTERMWLDWVERHDAGRQDRKQDTEAKP